MAERFSARKSTVIFERPFLVSHKNDWTFWQKKKMMREERSLADKKL